ncbi:RWD domain-containing protein 1-like [Glandiceps talaboti]
MDLETEQADELEALRAIFEDDFTDISSHPPCFMIKCSNLDVELTGPLYLKIVFSEKYPEIPPNVEIPMRGDIISTTQHKQLLQHLNQTAEATVGMAMIFTLVDAAKEWLSENIKASSDSVPELEENVQFLIGCCVVVL